MGVYGKPRIRIHNLSRNRGTLRWVALLLSSTIAYLFWIHEPVPLQILSIPWSSEYESWLHEIASLMTELYETLEAMRYIKTGAIAYPPHQHPTINTTVTSMIGLSAEAVALLQMLPYVTSSRGWVFDAGGNPIVSAVNYQGMGLSNEFVLGSKFTDMRSDQMLRDSREPWYGKDSGAMAFLNMTGDLQPWYLTLALTG